MLIRSSMDSPNEMQVHALVRRWIAAIIGERASVMSLAIGQRAKFEGWLKFELADMALRNGAEGVRVEPVLSAGRADLCFEVGGARCVVELKTPNTNYRMDGVEAHTRPITNNIASIIVDAEKLAACGGGVIAFILFPLATGDRAWERYLDRISEGVGQRLDLDQHVTRLPVQLRTGSADIAIVTFDVPSKAAPTPFP